MVKCAVNTSFRVPNTSKYLSIIVDALMHHILDALCQFRKKRL